MRSRYPAVVALALGLCLATAGVAQAQKPDYAAAKKAYKKAQRAIEKGEWSIAAREFGVAYDITKDPVLFYNIADANDKAGDCDAALVYYGRYLKEGNPDEKFLSLTKAAIKECKRKLKLKKPTPDKDPVDKDPVDRDPVDKDPVDKDPVDKDPVDKDPIDEDDIGTDSDLGLGDDGARPPTLTDEKPSWKRTAAWVSVGATVALATTGAVLGLSASSREEDIENLISFRNASGDPATFDGNTSSRYDDLIDEGKSLNGYAKLAFIGAGVAAVAATAFFIIDAKSPAPAEASASRRNIVPIVTAGGVGLAAGWEF